MKTVLSCRVTILAAIGALAVHALPASADAALQLDRAAFAAGEWWRIVSCHFTHWSADHFAWDFMMFALLGGACEWTSRRRMVVALLASLGAIPLAVLAFQPELATYRGLSGLGSAFFMLLAVEMVREKLAEGDGRSVLAIGLLIAGFFVKTGVEVVTGQAVFTDSAAAGFVPVPLAHLVGAVIGAAVGIAGYAERATGCDDVAMNAAAAAAGRGLLK